MKVLLENLLRYEDGRTVTKADIEAIAAWLDNRGKAEKEIAFRPARVLMQDFTGVPAVVDLAAMRDAMKNLGGDPRKINPLVPVDLVIDHSVIVDEFGTPQAFEQNVELEYSATASATASCNGARPPSTNFSRRPARHRHLPPGQPRIPLADRLEPQDEAEPIDSPIPTRSSAPTPTPPWSTASPCSAGASAASRPRRRCSASRSRC